MMNEAETTKTHEKNTPAHKIRLGQIAVSIWENSFDNGRQTYRAVIEKTYRNKRGIWEATSTFRTDDLVLVSKLAELASSWMLERESD
jgi:hypothetical protein